MLCIPVGSLTLLLLFSQTIKTLTTVNQPISLNHNDFNDTNVFEFGAMRAVNVSLLNDHLNFRCIYSEWKKMENCTYFL